jgi:transcription antitermination factor NusG
VTEIGGAMQSQLQECQEFPNPPLRTSSGGWFAIQTKPRHEKRVASALKDKEVMLFLPLYNAVHQWSDRRQQLQLPLFPNYVFVRTDGSHSIRTLVLRTNGVRSFVGMRGVGTCVPDEEIEAVQRILAERVTITNSPFLTIGQKVRICGGSLEGVQGILVAANNAQSLVISVECIQRSLSIRIDGYRVEPV